MTRQPYICPYCGGTYWQGDETCSDCGRQVRAPLLVRVAVFILGAIAWAVVAVIIAVSAIPNLAWWSLAALIALPYLAVVWVGRLIRRNREP
jgi:hypothetical protein